MKNKCAEISICTARDSKRCDMRYEEPSVASAGYIAGQRVRIRRLGSREEGVTGTVGSATGLISVSLDKGPPWRGLYEPSELEAI